MRFADGKKSHDHRLARLNLDRNLFARLQAIEKGRRRQHTRIRVGLPEFVVFQINVRIEQVAKQRVNLDRVTYFFLQLGLFLGKVGSGKIRAGTSFQRGLAPQNNALQLLWPSSPGNTERARKHFHHRIRQRDVVVFGKRQQIGGLHFISKQEQRHVADRFAGGSDLHNVAKQLVHLGVDFFHFAPAVA